MADDLEHIAFDVLPEEEPGQNFTDDIFDTDFEAPILDEDGGEDHSWDTERKLEVTQKILERTLNEELRQEIALALRRPGGLQKYRQIREDVEEIEGLVLSDDGQVIEKYRE